MSWAKRILPLAGLVAACLFGFSAIGAGASALYAVAARANSETNPAISMSFVETAIRWRPDNPEAHIAKARLLLARKQFSAVQVEMEEATQLLPRDYFTWLETGRFYDLASNNAKAIEAMRKASALAPYYSDVAWNLGNTYIRAGQLEEGWAELNKAAESDSTLWPSLLDLAWGLYGGEIEEIERVLKPRSDKAHLAFAKFYAKLGQSKAAMKHLLAAGNVQPNDYEQLLALLFASHQYQAARTVWLRLTTGGAQNSSPKIINAGFETPLSADEKWFGWQAARAPALFAVNVDKTVFKEGQASVKIEFSGDVGVGSELLAQIVPVNPTTSYRLDFFAKTDELVTGGLPVLQILEAGNRKMLASVELPADTTDWRKTNILFKTGETSQAVILSLQRKGCSNSSQCPIFGKLWLDEFSLVP
jgi:tetratricopeptide (TPR) repeat protein